jgi:uncharacterized protein with ParB-like and HNH nuclease domain
MDVEATKDRLEQLVEEINNLSSRKIRFHQQAKVKKNMAIKGSNGTLYIQPTTTAYDICLYGQSLEAEMSSFMQSLCGNKCMGYKQSNNREPFWRVDDFEIVREAVFRYAGIPCDKYESVLPIVSTTIKNKENIMDPKTVFIEQVNRFLDEFFEEFADAKKWIIKKDTLNNIVILIPSEWVMHSQLNGISLQFALNVKGELVLSISIENPITLENRIGFKNDLYVLMEKNNFFETTYIGCEINLNQRGKFLRKVLPILSDSYTELLDYINKSKQLVPVVVSLLKQYKENGKIDENHSFNMKVGLSEEHSTRNRVEKDDIVFDDGENNYAFQYNKERKIFTHKAEYSVEHLHKMFRRGKLNLQPDFQRQFVWDKKKASSLIESLLLDVPIPVIYLAEDSESTLLVIDGQQRLSSIFSFIDGNLPDGQAFKLIGLTILRDLNQKGYAEIDELFQEKLEECALSTITIKKESDYELQFEIFERLNTGSVKLNDQELRNCLYRGPYLDLLKKLSVDPDYRYIMGLKGPDKRMKDVEYVLHFGAFYHQTYLKYEKVKVIRVFLNDEMKKFQNISDEDREEFQAKFKKAVQINKSLFGNRSFRKIRCGDNEDPNSVWKNTVVVNSSLFDVLMVSFLEYDKNLIMRNLDAIREAMISLMTENQEFIDTIEKWTYSYEHVKRRFEIFNQTISDILKSGNNQDRLFSYELKEKLFKLNNTCAICGQKIYMIEDSAVDHIEQYWLGGKTIPDNSRLTHRYCNASRKRKERD